MRCLVVEDYQPLLTNLVEYLSEEGYVVDGSATGDEGLWYARNHSYDVIVLDIMLPEVDGLTILKKLRSLQDKTPVLVVSARDAVADRIVCLDAGADDYLVKPFDLDELGARARVLVRRRYNNESSSLKIADLEIDVSRKMVARGGLAIKLSAREYAILEYLAHRTGQSVSRTEIWDHVYEDESGGSSNAVDVYIGYIRKKLNAGEKTDLIHTRRGFGYTLSAKAP